MLIREFWEESNYQQAETWVEARREQNGTWKNSRPAGICALRKVM
jgi:hypothetical protein